MQSISIFPASIWKRSLGINSILRLTSRYWFDPEILFQENKLKALLHQGRKEHEFILSNLKKYQTN